jgi:hypothetical protein
LAPEPARLASGSCTALAMSSERMSRSRMNQRKVIVSTIGTTA